jgi:IS30 family transposase
MRKYHQLTEQQRYQIYALKKAEQDQQTIASIIGISPSTVSREIRRNRGQRGYRAHQAHQKALSRRRDKAQAIKMTPCVVARVEALIAQDWSPEQVSGRLRRKEGVYISPERIYQHLRADRQAGGRLWSHLRQSGKKRKKRYGKPYARGPIKNRVSIDVRPAIVDEKSRIGDWEIDLVIGAKHQGALLTLVERRSRYTLVGKVASKHADEVAAKAIELLRPYQGLYLHRDGRQRQRVCRPSNDRTRDRGSGLFRPSLPFMGARTQREYQRLNSPIHTQRRVPRTPNTTRRALHQKPTQPQTTKMLGLPNSTRSLIP